MVSPSSAIRAILCPHHGQEEGGCAAMRSIWNRKLFTISLLFGLIFCAFETAEAHNLNQRMDYIGFDPETLARM